MALIITSISSKTDYLVTDSTGKVSVPLDRPIWSLVSPHIPSWYEDDIGSKEPRVFAIPTKPLDEWIVPISFIGAFPFPQSWKGNFRIQANLKGAPDIILYSEPQIVLPSPGGAVPIPMPVVFSDLRIKAPLTDLPCFVPFGCAGDFEWTIVNVENDKNEAKALVPTRLELYWAIAPATAGPSFVRATVFHTLVNFRSSYPVALLRLFWPRATEFRHLPNFDDYTVFTLWYITRAVEKIWAQGTPHLAGRPQFDSTCGGSSYSMTAIGGSFDLRRWLADCLPDTRCNSFDLGGIVQLACSVFLTREGVEWVRSQWIFQQPSGFILPGMLYGQDKIPNCNNPFFELRKNSAYIDPALNPLEKQVNRSSYATHVWIEAQTDIQTERRVLDVTQSMGTPEDGARGRKAYSNAHIDPVWNNKTEEMNPYFGNLINNSAANPQGSCFQDQDIRLTLLNELRFDRIGVIDVDGLPRLPLALEELRLPGKLRPTVEWALSGTNNFQASPLTNCNADLSQAAIAKLFSAVSAPLQVKSYISISKDLVRVSVDILQTVTLGVKLDLYVHTSPEAVMSTMVYYLAGFEVPLEEIVTKTPDSLGSLSLQTPQSFAWIRGTIMVVLWYSIPSILRDADKAAELAQRTTQSFVIARQLDQYFEQAQVKPEDQLKLEVAFAKAPPQMVRTGEAFTVSILTMDELLPDSICRVDDAKIIVGETVMSDKGEFNFMALRTGITILSFYLVHKTTMYPASHSYVVEVVDELPS